MDLTKNQFSGQNFTLIKNEPKPCTLEEYMALPEGTLAELIDGKLYMMSSPSFTHQRISGYCHWSIENHIRTNNGKCIVLSAPFDVKLFEERDTIVQPDILVVCDPDKIDEQMCHGAPDFVIEIVSPSNGAHDYSRKLTLYQDAGVREYWIVNPAKQHVLVYLMNEDNFDITIYPFTEDIPVHIYDGKLKLNFSEFVE